jgi:hypothetical protein
MKRIITILSIIFLTIFSSTTLAETSKMIIDKMPVDYFKPENGATLQQYKEQQDSMQKALYSYWNGKFNIIKKKTFLSSSFGIGIKRQLDSFVVEKLHGKKIEERIVDGLSSVTIWKVDDEYFSLAVSEMIPGGNAIYGYYEIEQPRP